MSGPMDSAGVLVKGLTRGNDEVQEFGQECGSWRIRAQRVAAIHLAGGSPTGLVRISSEQWKSSRFGGEHPAVVLVLR